MLPVIHQAVVRHSVAPQKNVENQANRPGPSVDRLRIVSWTPRQVLAEYPMTVAL
jgi:hypothetical protein